MNKYIIMPEGPEVTVMQKQMNLFLKGKWLRKITIINGPYKTNDKKQYKDARKLIDTFNEQSRLPNKSFVITGVHKIGKLIYMVLAQYEKQNTIKLTGKIIISSHLGLTGKWTKNKEDKSRMEFKISDKPKSSITDTFYYTDQLCQGRIYIDSISEFKSRLKSRGPDVQTMTYEVFKSIMSTKKAMAKKVYEAIVDQSLIGGIGNYLRSDIIYESKLPPLSNVSDLSDDQLKALYTAIIKTYKTSMSQNGHNTYCDFLGMFGKYIPKIYDQDKSPSGETITKLTDKQKRTFYYVAA